MCDEPGYEGNIYWGWGDLTGEELTRRFWEGVMRGGYVTHGETYIDRGEQIWWAHGGELHGDAPARIAFMRGILERAPLDAVPSGVSNGGEFWDVPVLESGDDWRLVYFGWARPAYRDFRLPGEGRYEVDVIDTWNMTVEPMPGDYAGTVRVPLGRQWLAVRIRRIV